jgi:hypothetical protein
MTTDGGAFALIATRRLCELGIRGSESISPFPPFPFSIGSLLCNHPISPSVLLQPLCRLPSHARLITLVTTEKLFAPVLAETEYLIKRGQKW